MLKSSLLFFLGALLIVLCLPFAGRNPQAASSVSAQNAAPAGKNPVKPTAESQVKAKMLYARDCAFCHGDNGNGKENTMGLALDDWTNPNSLANKTDSELFAVIRSGKGQDAGRGRGPRHRHRGPEPGHLHSLTVQRPTARPSPNSGRRPGSS